MKIRVRKEVVKCANCQEKNEFIYLSDFSYGERLVLYDRGHKYAYINLLEDDIYDEFVENVTSALKIVKKNTSKLYVQKTINNILSITFDNIEEKESFFGNVRRCTNCDSSKFEDTLVEPEIIEEINLPIVTHERWKNLSNANKLKSIVKAIKELDFSDEIMN